jgi:hypothetical protein
LLISYESYLKYGCPHCCVGHKGHYAMIQGPIEALLKCSNCLTGYIIVFNARSKTINGDVVEHPASAKREVKS